MEILFSILWNLEESFFAKVIFQHEFLTNLIKTPSMRLFNLQYAASLQ